LIFNAGTRNFVQNSWTLKEGARCSTVSSASSCAGFNSFFGLSAYLTENEVSIKFFRDHGQQSARQILFRSHQIRLPEQHKTEIILSIKLIYFEKFDEAAIERFKWWKSLVHAALRTTADWTEISDHFVAYLFFIWTVKKLN